MNVDMNFLNRGNVQTMRCLQLAIALPNISTEQTFKQPPSWCECLSAEVNLPSPVGNGWMLKNDDELEITWMARPRAPQSLIECVECKCKSGCLTMRCSCRKAELKCTDLCSCCDCQKAGSGDGDEDVDENIYHGVALPDDEELGESDLDFEDGGDDL